MNLPPQKILRLKISNYMKLSAVEIAPSADPVVSIGGFNGAGKSAVLGAIESAFRGAEAFPEGAVHEGAERAEIVAETDDLVITRKITAKGHSVKVTNRKDANIRYSSPQEMLSALYGRISFDPAAFQRMKPLNQRTTLQELVGVSFERLDTKKQELYNDRVVTGRTLTERKGALASLPPLYPDVPEKEISIDDLTARLDAARKANQQADGLSVRIRDQKHNLGILQINKESLEQQLRELDGQIEEQTKNLTLLENMTDLFPRAAETTIIAEMRALETTNVKIRANIQRREAETMFTMHERLYATYTERIDAIDTEKSKLLEEAKFPVRGLGFTEKGVTYNGKPFADASTAEQIRISVAMGMAMNPNLKVILIRDASLLDKLSFSVIEEMARAHGYQIWMEVVTDTPEEEAECSVVIVDGNVKE